MNANERLWNKNVALIQRFYRMKGRWPRRSDDPYHGMQIGRWLYRVRRSHIAGDLESWKSETLKKIGYGFERTWNPNERWNRYFNYLKNFREKHPDKWPSPKVRYPANVSLGSWCYVQKRKYNEGELSKEHLKLLESIGFPFKKIVSWEGRFERQLEYLKRYRKKYPDIWPKITTEFPGGNKLGIWCNNMKRLRRDMPMERVEKLNAIGFDWDPLQTKWDRNYEFVEKYLTKNKRLPSVRVGSSEREIKATDWIHTQRTKLILGKMPQKERLLLSKLGIR